MNRNDFPQLQDGVIYLDNAATTFKPKCVIERINDFYMHENANIYRGLYDLSVKATAQYDEARQTVAKFINAEPEEIIFTSGTTDGINKFTQMINAKDKIVASDITGHHSNLLPWRKNAKKFKYIPSRKDGSSMGPDNSFVVNDFIDIAAMSMYSNAFGDTKSFDDAYGRPEPRVIFFADAAQAIAHKKIDVKTFRDNPLALAFSGHKIFGPTGIGVLYISKKIHDQLSPAQFGGEMVEDVREQDFDLAPIPQRFEAGTPNIAGAIGLAEAIRYFSAHQNEFFTHEKKLAAYAHRILSEIEGLKIISVTYDPIISFTIDSVHPHDVAQYLAVHNICVRAGYHCAQVGLDYLGIGPVTRISLAPYNTFEEIDKTVEVLKNIRKDMYV